MSKRKPYMHKHFMSMMRINPSADAEGRHSEGKKPYSFKRPSYKQMEDLDFKDLARLRQSEISNPCSGHRDLSGGFMPLSLKCGDGLQEIKFEVGEDFVTPVIVADEDGLSFTDKPINKDTIYEIETGETLLSFDPDAFSGDGIEIICIDVVDAACGGKSTFCMFLIGCDECVGIDCDLPVLSGPTLIGLSTTGQFTLSDPQGDVSWGISGGGGATIDQNGLVTTDANACGTATVTATDSCCGDFTQDVRLGDATTSQWSNISSESGTLNQGATCTGICNNSGSGNQDCVIGALRYRGTRRETFYDPFAPACDTCAECEWDYSGPDYPSCWSTAGASASHCFWYVNQLFIDEWICNP